VTKRVEIKVYWNLFLDIGFVSAVCCFCVLCLIRFCSSGLDWRCSICYAVVVVAVEIEIRSHAIKFEL